MATLNIRTDVSDPFYRYKMPRLLAKVEGKGNGIKTVIPNMTDIGRSLSRPPTYTTKFFGCELGAQTTLDDKNDRYIVNGAHEAKQLQDLLDKFIDKFVLCGSCKNPETDLLITKTESITKDCKACGARTDVDMRHKLTTYILKNPPKKKAKKGGRKSGGGDGEGAEAETNGNGAAGHKNEEGSDDDDELTRRINAEAAELPPLPQNGTKADDDWSVDTSAEAVKARMKELETGVKSNLVITEPDDDDDEGGAGPYDLFGEWLENDYKRDGTPDEEVYEKAKELGIENKHKAVQVLVQCIFDGDIVKAKQVEKHVALLKKMITTEKAQKSLLGGTERLVGVSFPDLIPLIPKILMTYYQNDLLEEDVVSHWGTRSSKKYVDKETSKKVRRAAEPFLKWLEEAEDDEDESEEEEQD